MNTTTETRRVYQIDSVDLVTEAKRTFVFAVGTANSSASDARLVPSQVPTIPEALVFDLVADHDAAPTMTQVDARRTVDVAGIRTITVRGERNEITIEISQRQASAPASSALPGTEWSVRHFVIGDGRIPVIPGTQLTARFDDQGAVEGSSGCNTYRARYVIRPMDPPGITIDALSATKINCGGPEGVMEQEVRFHAGLCAATGFECGVDELTLTWDGNFAIVFAPIERPGS